MSGHTIIITRGDDGQDIRYPLFGRNSEGEEVVQHLVEARVFVHLRPLGKITDASDIAFEADTETEPEHLVVIRGSILKTIPSGRYSMETEVLFHNGTRATFPNTGVDFVFVIADLADAEE